MIIKNNSSFIICVRFGENMIQEILPKQTYNIEIPPDFDFFLKNDSSIVKKKHKNALVLFSIVSQYTCVSQTSNPYIEVDVETDSMLFGVEYICAMIKKSENIVIKEKNFYIKDLNNIDSLFEERYNYNFKQDLQMDYINSLAESPVVFVVAMLMKIRDYNISSIATFSLLFLLLIFFCNRVYTLLTKRKESKYYKIDKNSFYEKCSAEYITCFYQTKIKNYSKKTIRGRLA
ncbi:MAG: hypothetical protein E7557_05065 [Ruminococcaceae bacterium]|nr:hypothetical protein [Oscillospiraceae bacterium]